MAKKQKEDKSMAVDAVTGASMPVVRRTVTLPEPPVKTIKIVDNRKIDAISGLPLSTTKRKHAEIPEDYVSMVIDSAKKHGVDPATALAIGLQETGYQKDLMNNPFMLGNYNQYAGITDQSLKFMADKIKYAKKLGKTSEEDIIQAYNGYGKLAGRGKMYGIDTDAEPIDMAKTPLYGKTVKHLRDSVIMQNPDIVKMINKGSMSTPVQKLKCGGKKKKKMAGGGVVPYEKLGSIAGDMIESTITAGIPSAPDTRVDPSSYLKKRDNLTTAGSIGKNMATGAGIGASIGAIGGPVGAGAAAAIGAGVGALVTGAKELFMSKKKKEARASELQDWQQGWAQDYAVNTIKSGYKSGGKKGGEIKGEGGPKSDAIDKNVEDGSFIVPAENAEKAMELGKAYLGWNGNETANRTYPGTEVAVSDGEVLFTPEEVDVLRYHGLDLNRLAPNAKPGDKLASGGWKYDNETEGFYYDPDAKGDDPGAREWVEANNADHSQDAKTTNEAIIDATTTPSVTTDTTTDTEVGPLGKIASFAPEIAGALQIAAGAVGLSKAGRMPDINVSESLRDITTQARQEAQYGLEPGTKSAMINQAEKARRDTTNAIVARGGSANEVNSNLQNALSTIVNSKFDIELADSAEKIRKKSTYYGLKTKMADQEFDISRMAREDWMQMQEVNAGLLNAGISNIVGARKLKATMDMMKKTGNSSADISKIV